MAVNSRVSKFTALQTYFLVLLDFKHFLTNCRLNLIFHETPELGLAPQLADHTMTMIDEDHVEEDTAHLAEMEDTVIVAHLVAATTMRSAEEVTALPQELVDLRSTTTHLHEDDMKIPIAETSPLIHMPMEDHHTTVLHQEITLPESLLMGMTTADDTGKFPSSRPISDPLTN